MDLTCLCLPVMRRQGYGRIVQMSSVLGLTALTYRGAYVAAKFALEGLTDTLRLELAGSGVQVSLIEPGSIESRFRANSYEKFHAHIDREHSPHREPYRAVEERLLEEGPVMSFTRPPQAVLAKLIHALESRRPRPRYICHCSDLHPRRIASGAVLPGTRSSTEAGLRWRCPMTSQSHRAIRNATEGVPYEHVE